MLYMNRSPKELLELQLAKPGLQSPRFSSNLRICPRKFCLRDPEMAMNSGLRSCASKLLNSSPSIAPKSVSRGIHSTSVKKMGGGHGHDEPYYLHAKHMYNLDRMKNQKLKMTLGVFTAFTIGAVVPVYAVIFQQRKTASA